MTRRGVCSWLILSRLWPAFSGCIFPVQTVLNPSLAESCSSNLDDGEVACHLKETIPINRADIHLSRDTNRPKNPTLKLMDVRSCSSVLGMESEVGTRGLSTAAMVAVACNTFVAILLLLLCLIVYRACRVPSSPGRLPVLAPSETESQQVNEHKYLLTS